MILALILTSAQQVLRAVQDMHSAKILWAALNANVLLDFKVMVSHVRTLTSAKTIFTLAPNLHIVLKRVSNRKSRVCSILIYYPYEDSIGSYTCQCRIGFFGDGMNCENVDECRVLYYNPEEGRISMTFVDPSQGFSERVN